MTYEQFDAIEVTLQHAFDAAGKPNIEVIHAPLDVAIHFLDKGAMVGTAKTMKEAGEIAARLLRA